MKIWKRSRKLKSRQRNRENKRDRVEKFKSKFYDKSLIINTFRTLNNNESTSKEIFAGPTNEEDLDDLIPDIMKHE